MSEIPAAQPVVASKPQPPVAPKAAPAPAAQANVHKEARGIIRILGKDLRGNLTIAEALPKIKGVGRNLARSLVGAVADELKIPALTHVGDLTDAQIQSIETIIKSPSGHGVRPFLFNRAKDPETGVNNHVLQTDLQLALRNDLELEKSLRTWIGWRHQIGQKVHGQHNRTTGRTGMTVGVLKKAVKAQKEAASKGAQDAGKKPAAPEKK
jgi:small subunit ribosomal protein S13